MPVQNLISKTWHKAVAIVGAVTMLAGFIGGWIWLDTHWASAAEVKRVEKKIDKHQLKDDIRWYQDQKIYLKTQHGAKTKHDLPDAAFQEHP